MSVDYFMQTANALLADAYLYTALSITISCAF